MRNAPRHDTNEQEVLSCMQQDAADIVIAGAVRTAPLPELPADFAARLANQLHVAPKRDGLGLRLSVYLLVAQLVCGLYFVTLLVRENLEQPFGRYLPLVLVLMMVAAGEQLLAWKPRAAQRG